MAALIEAEHGVAMVGQCGGQFIDGGETVVIREKGAILGQFGLPGAAIAVAVQDEWKAIAWTALGQQQGKVNLGLWRRLDEWVCILGDIIHELQLQRLGRQGIGAIERVVDDRHRLCRRCPTNHPER
jgi:hypothetical protein